MKLLRVAGVWFIFKAGQWAVFGVQEFRRARRQAFDFEGNMETLNVILNTINAFLYDDVRE